MLAFLSDLTAKYGERPSVLATQADFSLDPRESEKLLLRAFDLALNIKDVANIREISLSLADLYTNQLSDLVQAPRWLEIAGAQLDGGNDADLREFRRIESDLSRAKGEQ